MNIFEAAINGNLEELNKLIKAGAEVNAKDEYGQTALIYAAWNGHTDCVTELIAAGADVNAKNDDGNTALILAARNGHTDCVSILEQAQCGVAKNKAKKVQLKPHLQKIVNYIRKHGSVTVREATLSKELNTVELRKRISEINRAKGYEFIAGTYEPNRDGGQHKRYRLCK